MEFDSSKLMMNVMLMWGDDSCDMNDALTVKNSSVLSSEKINELVIKTSLSSPVPYGHIIYSDNRQFGDLVNSIDAPIVYAKLTIAMKDGPVTDEMSEIYKDEYFNELCVITGISIVDDKDKNSVLFKLDFELAEYLNFTSNLKPYSTFSDSSDTDTSDNVIKALFGSAGLGNKLDSDTLTIKSPVKFITTENATLTSSLRFVFRDMLHEEFSDTNEKSFVKIRYNYTTHKFELWKLSSFGTNAAVDGTIDGEIYSHDVMFVNSDVSDRAANMNDRIIIMSDRNESMIPQLLGNKTMYGFDYEKAKFSINEHKTPETTFLTQEDAEFSGTLYKKFSKIRTNSMINKEIEFKDSLRNGSVDCGLYDMIDDIVMHSRYLNSTSSVVLRRKAGDTMFVQLQNSYGTDYTFFDGVYLVTESTHTYKRFDKSAGGKQTFRTNVNLFSPYSHKNSTKIEKKI